MCNYNLYKSILWNVPYAHTWLFHVPHVYALPKQHVMFVRWHVVLKYKMEVQVANNILLCKGAQHTDHEVEKKVQVF